MRRTTMGISSAFTLSISVLLFSCSDNPNLNGHYHIHYSHNTDRYESVDIVSNRMSNTGDTCVELKVNECSELRFKGDSVQIWPFPCFKMIAAYKLKADTLILYDQEEFGRFIPMRQCTIDHAALKRKWEVEDSLQYIDDTPTTIN